MEYFPSCPRIQIFPTNPPCDQCLQSLPPNPRRLANGKMHICRSRFAMLSTTEWTRSSAWKQMPTTGSMKVAALTPSVAGSSTISERTPRTTLQTLSKRAVSAPAIASRASRRRSSARPIWKRATPSTRIRHRGPAARATGQRQAWPRRCCRRRCCRGVPRRRAGVSRAVMRWRWTTTRGRGSCGRPSPWWRGRRGLQQGRGAACPVWCSARDCLDVALPGVVLLSGFPRRCEIII
mmetsp:Transcript_46390/g.122954  ORF Transcript_46390/g.122954 Transcript_46390/m.122954 type:complete len:236 (-) Transcript_46390:355-1062(-)